MKEGFEVLGKTFQYREDENLQILNGTIFFTLYSSFFSRSNT